MSPPLYHDQLSAYLFPKICRRRKNRCISHPARDFISKNGFGRALALKKKKYKTGIFYCLPEKVGDFHKKKGRVHAPLASSNASEHPAALHFLLPLLYKNPASFSAVHSWVIDTQTTYTRKRYDGFRICISIRKSPPGRIKRICGLLWRSEPGGSIAG
jgi:hypothetical protein